MVERAASEVFDADGVVHLPGVAPPDEVHAMRARVCEAVEALGGLVEQEGALRPAPGSEHAMAEVVQGSAFDPLAAHVGRILDAIFGANVWAPATGIWRGVALPNFAGAESAWRVPHRYWHVDEPVRRRARPWSIGAFVFLDRVVAGGGTTLVMTGSARRLRALGAELTLEESTAELARVEPWVDALLRPGEDDHERRRRFMSDGCVSAGVPLRIVELTGEPGDVVLMDPRSLHAPSANVGGPPRLVVKMACVYVGADRA